MIKVRRITNEEEIKSLTILGEELIEKILNQDCALLGGFARDYQLITIAVIELNASNEVVVRFLYTDEEYRELGHATLMLEEIERVAKNNGAKGVIIDYNGPKGSYEETSYILGKIDYSEKYPQRTLITLRDFSIESGMASMDEIEAQMKNLKYTKKSIEDFAKGNDKLSKFVSKEGITECDNGQLAFIKNKKIIGAIFFGNQAEKSVVVKGLYIDKEANQKDILYALLCLVTSLKDTVKEKNIPLEIISHSSLLSDVINKLFPAVEYEEDCGFFLKKLV